MLEIQQAWEPQKPGQQEVPLAYWSAGCGSGWMDSGPDGYSGSPDEMESASA